MKKQPFIFTHLVAHYRNMIFLSDQQARHYIKYLNIEVVFGDIEM